MGEGERYKQLAADSFIMGMSEAELRAALLELTVYHPVTVLDAICRILAVTRGASVA